MTQQERFKIKWLHIYDPEGPHLSIYTEVDYFHTREQLQERPPFYAINGNGNWRNVRLSPEVYEIQEISAWFEPGTPKQ